MQELENENDKLKREVNKLMTSIAGSTSFDKGRKISPAGKEFLGNFPLFVWLNVFMCSVV